MELMISRLPILKSTFDQQQLKLIVVNLFVDAMQFSLHIAKQGNSIKMTQTTFL